MSDRPYATGVIELLRARGQTLATAESLTGGLLGALLTEVPGASTVYRGGLVPYATELKATLAGVRPETLTAYGPVAAATARELALGAADRCSADWALATTGVAGPDPQDGHPVGTVFVAAAETSTRTVTVEELRLRGSRAAIRAETARRAVDLLDRVLSAPAHRP